MPYTYIIGWRKERKFYYGVRWANTCTPEDDLWNKYFTSSKSMVPLMRTLYGEPDLIKVHREFIDKKEAILFEEQMLRRLDVLNNPIWLNQNINRNYIRTAATRRKNSEGSKGRKKSPEEIQKMRIAATGKKWDTQRKLEFSISRSGENHHYYGKNFTDDHRKKLSIAKKGNCNRGVKIIIDGKKFKSHVDASKYFGVHRKTIGKWIKRGKGKTI